jgi:NADH:ubiquinone oxidoreductase subunit 3 (subunit A)
MDETSKYGAVLFMGIASLSVPSVLIMVSYFFTKLNIRPNIPMSPEVISGDARVKFNFRFYLFALLFLIFDVEILFLLPWAARFLRLGINSYIAMLPFLLLILVGFIYEWRKDALEWK